MRIKTGIVTGLLVLAPVAALIPAQTASAVAAGCDAAHPTSIGGTIYGYGGDYNNWSVNAQVGIDLTNSAGQKVDVNGNLTSAGYSAVSNVNPTLPAPGAATGYQRTWGAANGSPLCISANVTKAWLEVYPKTPSGSQTVTTKTYAGGAQHHAWALTVGSANSYTLRLPTNYAHHGNTGDVNGYLTLNGHKFGPVSTPTAGGQRVTIRAWSHEGTCGVFGFSAAPDALGASATQDGVYYDVTSLAGGQCNAPYQTYDLTVSICTWNSTATTCVSNGSQTKVVNIQMGARPRVDYAF